jgi:hypothetical protein
MHNQHHTCPFSHLILSGKCACEFSTKDCIAEKEFGACLKESNAIDCQNLYYALRNNSDFLFKTHSKNNLSVGQQSKLKMGGLLALQTILKNSNQKHIDNISTLVQQIKSHYQDFKKLPFSQLMPTIANYRFRKKP